MKEAYDEILPRHFLVLVAAALVWAAPAWTQATGTIVVTVVDDDSGQALETALVYIPALDLGGMSDAPGSVYYNRRAGG